MTAQVMDQPRQARSLLAAAWSAHIEQEFRQLPTSRRTRVVQHNERVLHQPGLEQHPYGRGIVRAENGQALLGEGPCPHRARTRSRAALVMIGRMAAVDLRYRAFYLDTSEPLTVAVHERPPRGSTGLLSGVELQRRAYGRLPSLVPRVLEARSVQARSRAGWSGLRRRPAQVVLPPSMDVVLEQWLPGRPVAIDDLGAVEQLLESTGALWELEPVVAARPDPAALARVRERFSTLVDSGEQAGLWPDDVDPPHLGRRVQQLLDADPVLTIGASHGDPGLGNALRTDQGQIVLVDWEDAGRRTLSHDVLKVLASSPVGPEDWLDRHPPLPLTGERDVLPVGPQLAVALLQFMSGWRRRTKAARKRGAMPAHQRRMHSMLRAVDQLLA